MKEDSIAAAEQELAKAEASLTAAQIYQEKLRRDTISANAWADEAFKRVMEARVSLRLRRADLQS